LQTDLVKDQYTIMTIFEQPSHNHHGKSNVGTEQRKV
jgi:hypothetical protein